MSRRRNEKLQMKHDKLIAYRQKKYQEAAKERAKRLNAPTVKYN